MNRQSWSGSAWVDSTEEFHYGYDSSGRLHDAAFAQTPQGSETNYANPAGHRARAWYSYYADGRIATIEHWWDDWVTSSYTSTAILGADYTYDDYKGLRTSTTFKIKNPGTPSAFMNDPAWSAAESYGYDADLDYLTDVDYNDGVSNEAQTWTYDAAGNRASDSTLSGGGSWTYDNLNRMYNGGGYGHENDILGNRTWRNYTDPGVRKYNWDAVNRLESTAGEDSGSGAAYKYRADGMRIQKVDGLYLQLLEDPETKSGYYDEIWGTDNPTTRYFYDGQMSVEEDYTRIVEENEVVDVTRYGIGARGIDMIAKDPYNAAETKYYPIYDGHGNNVALLSRDGSGFSVTNRRGYDAWGQIRQGSTSGEPFQRYCANLGHVQDDESGLQYMRARYYEPWTGRFVSEDPARNDTNWFSYCGNDPVNYSDTTGRDRIAELLIAAIIFYAIAALCLGLSFVFFRLAHDAGIDALRIYLKEMQGRGFSSDDIGHAAIREAYDKGWSGSGHGRRGMGFMKGAAATALMGHFCLINYLLIDLDLISMGVFIDLT